jgi:ATP-binding cassette, subfamily B, bacterial MsbA
MTGARGHSTSTFALYRRLLAYVGPERRNFILALFGFLLFSAANTGFAELVRQILLGIERSASLTPAERLLIPALVVAVVVLRGIGGFIGSYGMSLLAFRVVHRLRSELVQKMLLLPTGYYDRQNGGQLVSTVTFNTAQISGAVSDAIAVSLREGLTIAGILLYLLFLNWQLTLIFIAITSLIIPVVVLASRHLRRYSKRIQSSMGDVTQLLTETLRGLRVLRVFGASDQRQTLFVQASELNTAQNLKLAVTAAISAPIIQSLVGLAFALLLWLALAPGEMGGITPAQFVGFLTAAGMLFKPVRQTSKVNADIQKGLAAASSIFAIMDIPPEVDRGTLTVPRVAGRVEFRSVSFGYQGSSEPVLHDISLLCEPGQTVALVGQSGSGKSTLINLLPRFYETEQGAVLIDDRPVQEYRLANLRKQIAVVGQEVLLFSGSIRDNVACGELAGCSEAALIAALESAQAMEFIRELPRGLDTEVGDQGLLLSGGQRQRLAIARALLKDAPILILDEATSALDSGSERQIQLALQQLMQGRTTLVIAHRLSTVEAADQILVLDKGHIVERGTHQQLLARGGVYAGLYNLQFVDAESG